MAFQWTELKSHTIAPGDVAVPWVIVLETFGDATCLKFEATAGVWKVQNSILPACGPDGLSRPAMNAAELVLSGCPYGALIGKFGGSSAMHRAATAVSTAVVESAPDPALAADQPFAIGSCCVLMHAPGNLGPLFIGFNAVLRPIAMIEELTLKVFGAAA